MEKRNIISLPLRQFTGGPQWQLDIHLDEYLQRVDHRVSTVTLKPLHDIKVVKHELDPETGIETTHYRGVFREQNEALRARDNFLHPKVSQ